MTPPPTILAATDLSPPARLAADRAAWVAHEQQAGLTLLHVVSGSALADLGRWLGSGDTTAGRVLDEARRQLEQRARELHGARHVTVDPRCEPGDPLQVIDRVAQDTDAALLVLGARGQGFLRRLMLGTTSERLLRRTRRPVLVVRQVAHEPYRRVLVAMDFSPWTPEAVALARRFAPRAHLLLFHAWQVPFEGKLRYAGVAPAIIEQYRQKAYAEARRQVDAVAHAAGLRTGTWESHVVEGEASWRLVEAEAEHGCDLLVLGKHGQSAAEDLLLGSVTHHVLAEGTADVLVSTRSASSSEPQR